ncbi:hypothetical protein [Leptospira vanthielii]|uniref:DUF1850 domain-containing protein n=1 Tax=Leptospira vanthielii TaxID=293085 RepID=A0ABY2NJJ1_9LEPT|nr:hypothetical protein [Leptospira vanthielii]TGM45992.1 hypothetical protein EHQ95_17560 [Leptospira vanthielii]
MNRAGKFLSHWLILLATLLIGFDLYALPIYVPSMPEYKLNITPLVNFQETYVIVKILNGGGNKDETIYSYGLRQSSSRYQDFISGGISWIGLGVIPYKSISESKYYSKDKNSIGQIQIKENCRNYFPTSIGKKSYLIFLRDESREVGLEFPLFDIWEDFEIPPNKSLYLEIDIVKQEHKTSIIDMPKDVFSDMCK